MREEQFDQNFVWFEWSFVAPDDVPEEEQRQRRSEDEMCAVVGHSLRVVRDVRDENQQWMT